MKHSTSAAAVFFCGISAVLLFLFVAAGPAAAEAAAAGSTCNPNDLISCTPAFLGPLPPSGLCCAMVAAQRPCFCEYKKNPDLRNYFTTGQQVIEACGVKVPHCE